MILTTFPFRFEYINVWCDQCLKWRVPVNTIANPLALQ